MNLTLRIFINFYFYQLIEFSIEGDECSDLNHYYRDLSYKTLKM